MKTKRNITISLVFVLMSYAAVGQEKNEDRTPVQQTFRNTQLINLHTPENLTGLEFKIQHRFGKITDENILYDLLGMDLPANIRFSLSYPLTERLDVGIGRSKFNKVYDIEGKYTLLRQTTDNHVPVSTAIFANAGLSAKRFPEVPENAYFDDPDTTAFQYKFSHKLAYAYELIIARKFSDKFSLQLNPVLAYKNLVEPGYDNIFSAANVSGRLKFAPNSAILFEYGYRFNNRIEEERFDPISVAVEFGTAGHVFQLVASSSNYLLNQGIYTEPQADYSAGAFYLGFNIKRTWWL